MVVSTPRKKESKAFKDVRWPCGRCGQEKVAEHFVRNTLHLEQVTKDEILVRGAWRCGRS